MEEVGIRIEPAMCKQEALRTFCSSMARADLTKMSVNAVKTQIVQLHGVILTSTEVQDYLLAELLAEPGTTRITTQDIKRLQDFFGKLDLTETTLKKRKKELIEGILKKMLHLNYGQIDRQVNSYKANLDYRKELGRVMLELTLEMISGENPAAHGTMLHILALVYKDSLVSSVNPLPQELEVHMHCTLQHMYYI